MEEAIISLKTAQKLYDMNIHNKIRTDRAYIKKYSRKEENRYTGEEYITKDGEPYLSYKSIASPPYSYLGPGYTQSLTQRWLREEHDIHININYYKDEPFRYSINAINYNCENTIGEITYEGTLEKALYESLSLIK